MKDELSVEDEKGTMVKASVWGHGLTAASFWVHCVVCGIIYSSGLFHEMLLEEGGGKHLNTAVSSALLLGLSSLGGIPSMYLSYRIGCHWTVMLGALIAVTGFGLSWFAEHLVEYHLTFGLMGGLGLGLVLSPAIVIIESYFRLHSETASNLATSGVQIGTVLFPVCIYVTFDRFKWSGVAVLLMFFCLTLVGAGLIMRPPATFRSFNVRKGYIQLFRTFLLKSFAFDCILVSDFIWSFAIAIIYTFVPHYLTLSKDMNVSDGVMFLMVVGLSSFINRAVFIVFSRTARLDHCSTFLCTVILAAIITGLFPDLLGSKNGAIGYAIILGTHTGYWSTYVACATEDLIGLEYVAKGKGFIMLAVGGGLFSGPLVAAAILDYTNNIKIVFYLAGSCLVATSVLMMGLTLGKCYYRPYQDGSESDSNSSTSIAISIKDKVDDTQMDTRT